MENLFSKHVIIALTIVSSITAAGQDLKRKGFTGFSASYDGTLSGARVVRIIPQSPAEKAGLIASDVIKSINSEPIVDGLSYSREVSMVKGSDVLELKISRSGAERLIIVKAIAAPFEQNRNKTEYGVIQVDKNRLRTITTRPSNVSRKLPGVLLIQWLSCNSLELPAKSRNGIDTLLRSFMDSDSVVFMRVERPGTGDSEGGPCQDCGLEDEMAAYSKALEALKKRTDVDTEQIFLLGLSLGGSLAPFVGEGQNIKGYMISGACTQTWFEHMLDIDRRILQFSGNKPAEINEKIKGLTRFYVHYYEEKMTPGQIEEKYPELKGLWTDAPNHQYERPAKFYHSVQALNIEGAWQKVQVPVLIVYGENDWIMSEKDHLRIAEIVNNNKDGLATFRKIPGLDHSLNLFKSQLDSFMENGRVVNGAANHVFMDWLNAKIK